MQLYEPLTKKAEIEEVKLGAGSCNANGGSITMANSTFKLVS